MQSSIEREAFSTRLRQTLERAGMADPGATDLAREFNRRYPGMPVTPHATRKWLLGESIPAQARLRVLARWLGVSAEWLRFGEGAMSVTASDEPQPEVDFQLAREIAALSAPHREVVRELVRALRRAERGKD